MSGSKNCDTFTQWNITQHKEKGTPTLPDSMDRTGECIMLSEISQAVKNNYHMISPISGT